MKWMIFQENMKENFQVDTRDFGDLLILRHSIIEEINLL